MRPCLGRLAAASTKLCGRQPLLVSRCCSSVATCCLPRAPRGSFLAAASTKLCGRQPLLVSRCCSSVATCCLPAHSVCCLATPTLQANATTRPPQWLNPSSPLGRGSRVPWASLSPRTFFQTVTLSQRPYRLSCRGFESAVCRPSIGSTLRSGPTQHCLVQTAQPSAVALHTVLLKAQDFKPLNALQPPYTLSC